MTEGIIRYDEEFMRRFDALGAALEAGDRPALQRLLIDQFGFLFRACQDYWKRAASGDLGDFEDADEQTRRELLRPLSHRQYRLIQRAFQPDDDEDVLRSLWDFLHDEEHIYTKKVMSPAEVGSFSLILEEAYCCLARHEGEENDMYRFHGWETADITDARGLTPRDYYDLLSGIWAADTCAPRMRGDWSEDNPTLGQCSITAFLMQDIYGGLVRGVALGDGNYHCFNDVGGCVFDLTSEQFGDRALDYDRCPEQRREVHFARAEKQARYALLKARLEKALDGGN